MKVRTVSQPLFSLVTFPLFVSIDARKPELADFFDFFALLVLGGGSLDGPGTVSEGRGLFWRLPLEPDLDLDPGFLLPDLDDSVLETDGPSNPLEMVLNV